MKNELIINKILTIAYNMRENQKCKELRDNIKLSRKLDKEFKNSCDIVSEYRKCGVK